MRQLLNQIAGLLVDVAPHRHEWSELLGPRPALRDLRGEIREAEEAWSLLHEALEAAWEGDSGHAETLVARVVEDHARVVVRWKQIDEGRTLLARWCAPSVEAGCREAAVVAALRPVGYRTSRGEAQRRSDGRRARCTVAWHALRGRAPLGDAALEALEAEALFRLQENRQHGAGGIP